MRNPTSCENLRENQENVLCHAEPLFFLLEVRRVETQGAGCVSVSAVSAFLRRQVWRRRYGGRPQALWFPQEYR